LSSILAQVQVTAQSANIIVGQSEQMKATGLFGDGSSHDLTDSASWSSSNTAVASVTAGGMLTAVSSGQVVITASTQGVTGHFNVTVAAALVSITVTPSAPTIARQTTVQFLATGTYTDKSTQNLTSSVSWSSSNTAVATVSSTAPTGGLAMGVSAGQTTITASMGSISGTAALIVSSASVTSMTVNPANPTVLLGLTQQFTANAGFSDGTNQDVTGVTQWQSSATKVASITTSGLATAKSIGTSTITGTFGGMSASSLLTVSAANLASIVIQPSDGTMAPGTRKQLVAMGTFNDGSTRDITFLVTWTSSIPSIASVGAGTGIASALSPGVVTVTANLASVMGSTSLTVSNATIVSVLISPTNVTIPTGGSNRFTATGVFSDSSTQDMTASVTWSSSDTTVATVGNASGTFGFALGVSSGTANISATFSGAGASQTGTTVLTVSSATLTSIALAPATAEIAPASGLQYTATGTFSDGTKQNVNAQATWSSSNPSVALMSRPAFVIGESGGTATITAQIGPTAATVNLLVESATLTSIQVTPQNTSVAAGFETALTAVGTFSNGDTQDLTAFVIWTSSNSNIATIANGNATPGFAAGVQPGTTTISAVFAGQVGTASLTVTNATLTSITITPASASIPVGKSQQFEAIGSFSDGSTLNLVSQATWTSSNPGVATVNSQGLCDALSSGSSTISAELKGVQGTAILAVQ